jgi:hypothetical protein
MLSKVQDVIEIVMRVLFKIVFRFKIHYNFFISVNQNN